MKSNVEGGEMDKTKKKKKENRGEVGLIKQLKIFNKKIFINPKILSKILKSF